MDTVPPEIAAREQVAARRPPVGKAAFVLLLLRGVAYVALARMQLRHFRPSDVKRLNSQSEDRAGTLGDRSGEIERHLAHMAWLIPRIAERLPFRGDCLVQAIAAQEWLCDLGIPSRIGIGIRQEEGADFESHAWLAVGRLVVVGGDLKGFSQALA